MPGLPTSNPPQFFQGAPLLMIPNVPVTADFYCRILGFKTDAGAETPDYCVVWRDNAIAVPIETRPYGIRDFSIRDPNGVELVFGQDWD